MRKPSLFLSFVLALVLGNGAMAMDWETLKPKYALAKESGMIGEQPNGYIGAVRQGPDVDIIIERVNSWRKNRYQKIAADNGLPLAAVENQAGKRLLEKAEPGNYIQVNGKWVKK